MTEKPKPFARAVPYEGGARLPIEYAVVIEDENGADRCVWPGDLAYATASAERLNAAVDQRETNLRGALKVAVDALHAARIGEAVLTTTAGKTEIRITEAIAVVSAARGPNPPEYVLRSELDAERAKVVQLQKSLEGFYNSPSDHLVPFLRGLGVKEIEPKDWSEQELTRRQMEVDRERTRRTNAFAAKMKTEAEAEAKRLTDESVRRMVRDLQERCMRALRHAGLPSTPETFSRFVELMREQMSNGMEFDPERAARALVRATGKGVRRRPGHPSELE